MVGRIIICGLLFSMNVAGQEVGTPDSVPAQKSKKTLMGRLRQVQEFLDVRARKKVDPNYIEVPEKPWRIMLRNKESLVDVVYDNRFSDPGSDDRLDWSMNFRPPVAASLGVWLGYRGTGVSFSIPLAKSAGRNFSFTSTGAKYGFNFRLRRFSTDEMTFSGKLYEEGEVIAESKEEDSRMDAPAWIRSVYVNGYYVFNGRRYSQAAAYNQSVIQRRSAGSFLLGATWYQSSLDYSDKENSLMLFFGNNVRRIKLHQANIGVGYGYNWVPCRGLVVNAMAMPTISVYNRVKVYKYKCNIDPFGLEDETDDYGEWNKDTHTWANGKTQKPIFSDDEEYKWVEELDFWGSEDETTYSMLKLNVDLRVGIAYNWKNWFIGAQVQFNNFNYSKGYSKVNLFDAYARFQLGVRL
jgi:hypothetical protein